ncbi:MAG: phage holin family protein [Deltaproteobacteria bacterium]|nr:phage holin family protein [Deltaproteobacteria bacterium]
MLAAFLRVLFRLTILMLGILVAAYAVPGIRVEGYMPALKAALLLGLLNIFIKPVLVLLTLPITIVTLGLFTLVINASLFYLVGSVVEGFDVAGFFTALAGSLIISVLSIVLNRFARPGRP